MPVLSRCPRFLWSRDQFELVAQRQSDLHHGGERGVGRCDREQSAHYLGLRGDGSGEVGLGQAQIFTRVVKRANDLVDGVYFGTSVLVALRERGVGHLLVEKLVEAGLGGARHSNGSVTYRLRSARGLR